MTTNRPLTLRLEAPGDSELIAGWLSDESGEEHHFSGWLRLLTLLERARLMAANDAQHGASRAGTERRETRNQ